jgi:hypothetical protein
METVLILVAALIVAVFLFMRLAWQHWKTHSEGKAASVSVDPELYPPPPSPLPQGEKKKNEKPGKSDINLREDYLPVDEVEFSSSTQASSSSILSCIREFHRTPSSPYCLLPDADPFGDLDGAYVAGSESLVAFRYSDLSVEAVEEALYRCRNILNLAIKASRGRKSSPLVWEELYQWAGGQLPASANALDSQVELAAALLTSSVSIVPSLHSDELDRFAASTSLQLLLREATSRNVVKTSLLMLGKIVGIARFSESSSQSKEAQQRVDESIALIKSFIQWDEFTMYALTGLMLAQENLIDYWSALRQTAGIGRLHWLRLCASMPESKRSTLLNVDEQLWLFSSVGSVLPGVSLAEISHLLWQCLSLYDICQLLRYNRQKEAVTSTSPLIKLTRQHLKQHFGENYRRTVVVNIAVLLQCMCESSQPVASQSSLLQHTNEVFSFLEIVDAVCEEEAEHIHRNIKGVEAAWCWLLLRCCAFTILNHLTDLSAMYDKNATLFDAGLDESLLKTSAERLQSWGHWSVLWEHAAPPVFFRTKWVYKVVVQVYAIVCPQEYAASVDKVLTNVPAYSHLPLSYWRTMAGIPQDSSWRAKHWSVQSVLHLVQPSSSSSSIQTNMTEDDLDVAYECREISFGKVIANKAEAISLIVADVLLDVQNAPPDTAAFKLLLAQHSVPWRGFLLRWTLHHLNALDTSVDGPINQWLQIEEDNHLHGRLYACLAPPEAQSFFAF